MITFRSATLTRFVLPLLFGVVVAMSAPSYAAGPDIKEIKAEADKGNAGAQFMLGMIYVQGDGVQKDYTEAYKWFEKSAKQGNPGAQYNIGVMHALGEGRKVNYEEAANWYKKSAEQGYIDAQYNLGLMYYEGQGVKKDYAESARWLRRAASGLREVLQERNDAQSGQNAPKTEAKSESKASNKE